FANPGTSEMHFVAALDSVPEMRGVLALFEGVAAGAADGYARIADRPAAVLLHLGPGLGNAIANLHNARRARVPVVVVVGDHALTHKEYDAPLESDIDALAGNVSGWVKRSMTPDAVSVDTAEALAAARSGQVATLILPADVSWTGGAAVDSRRSLSSVESVDADAVATAAEILRSGAPTVLLTGGDANRLAGLTAAARVTTASGSRWLCETFPTRLERGAGVPAVDRLAYFAEAAEAQLAGARHLILAGASAPVSFFAYPGRRSDLVPDNCQVHVLAGHAGAAAALSALADAIASDVDAPSAPVSRPDRPVGELTSMKVAEAVGALLPERAIIVDEANTGGVGLPAATAGAPAHDVLTLTGGAIGFGMPAAIGAAVAAPDRPVLSLQADGSAMYTVSALWTQARENLDITTIVYNNSAYDILRVELQRVGAQEVDAPGPKARDLLDIGRPTLDFVSIAGGMGIPARRVTSGEELCAALEWAFAESGPHLIEAVVPSLVG
ncbi:MAG: thiamine pyrophosphate-dependent enzyme possible carboligase or decarboxylase, partial [Mycobacterium sp.]|nr:thiamine pyrophosphate-dependent enzyme possible carboligase or decarboxylase [Mycobacterium sp.]